MPQPKITEPSRRKSRLSKEQRAAKAEERAINERAKAGELKQQLEVMDATPGEQRTIGWQDTRDKTNDAMQDALAIATASENRAAFFRGGRRSKAEQDDLDKRLKRQKRDNARDMVAKLDDEAEATELLIESGVDVEQYTANLKVIEAQLARYSKELESLRKELGNDDEPEAMKS